MYEIALDRADRSEEPMSTRRHYSGWGYGVLFALVAGTAGIFAAAIAAAPAGV